MTTTQPETGAPLAPRRVAHEAKHTLGGAWVTTTNGRYRMLPGAGAAVTVTADGAVRIYGPQTHAWWADVPGGATVGVDVRPGRLGGKICGDVRELADQQIDLRDLLPGRQVSQFVDAILARQHDADERVGALQRETLRLFGAADPRVVAVEETLWSGGPAPVRTLAADAGLSVRQFHRLCTRAFGMGPAALRRLARFERFLSLVGRSPLPLAQLAHEAGYFDQQHLARDCRLLTERTPTEVLGACGSAH
ncbi:helix-turn-helix domain-containing protein [Nocardioidaceae bacterium SCSIO 66511]|nr:helix-turn-helix domain-containing protein [Nocardioidaceae bacterium SCSIO 66511]